MLRIAVALAMAPALYGQLTTDVLSKAPPAIEDALRARITEFYQDHVDGKFRQAEQLVAEESKDFFYSSNKPKYVSFEIRRIDWSENFTQAKATVVCQMYVMMPGFAGKPLPVPTPSLWKLVNGQWYWYVDPEALRMTPFGKMTPGGDAKGGPVTLPPMPSEKDIARILEQVKADKGAVELKAGAASSDQVTITNQMPGTIRMTVDAPKLAGLEVQAPAELKTGERAVVTFRYKPGGTKPAAVTATIHIEPTGQAFPVQIRFLP